MSAAWTKQLIPTCSTLEYPNKLDLPHETFDSENQAK